jgi:hypothetical protein
MCASEPETAGRRSGQLAAAACNRDDRLAHLSGLVVEECRRRGIVIPSPGALKQLCIQARYWARREVQRRLTNDLSAEKRNRQGADTAPGGNQPELAHLVAPDAAESIEVWARLP